MLKRDPTRAYFASVAFAILDVSLSSLMISRTGDDEPAIRGVLGKELTLSECPTALRPFMKELCAIGELARQYEEDDSLACVKALNEGKDMPAPRMDQVKEVLRGGVGWAYDVNHEREDGSGSGGFSDTGSLPTDPRRRRTSVENRAVAFANRVNALALGMTKLKAFRERQDTVFKVLIGVSG